MVRAGKIPRAAVDPVIRPDPSRAHGLSIVGVERRRGCHELGGAPLCDFPHCAVATMGFCVISVSARCATHSAALDCWLRNRPPHPSTPLLTPRGGRFRSSLRVRCAPALPAGLGFAVLGLSAVEFLGWGGAPLMGSGPVTPGRPRSWLCWPLRADFYPPAFVASADPPTMTGHLSDVAGGSNGFWPR
jgi:hypothetical protein